MRQVTLYWDDGDKFACYKNEAGTWRIFNRLRWRESFYQYWKPEDFKKSLTVNNFKEK